MLSSGEEKQRPAPVFGNNNVVSFLLFSYCFRIAAHGSRERSFSLLLFRREGRKTLREDVPFTNCVPVSPAYDYQPGYSTCQCLYTVMAWSSRNEYVHAVNTETLFSYLHVNVKKP